jgi:hypothetical protein
MIKEIIRIAKADPKEALKCSVILLGMSVWISVIVIVGAGF